MKRIPGRRPADVWDVLKDPLPWVVLWGVLAICQVTHVPYVLTGVIVTLLILSAVAK